jgi:NAD(P)-dependent dehydrogenase (short-subunit alcohol dehydrogenase family)
VAEEIFDAGGYSLAQTTDVTDASEVGAMVEATREAFGPVDVLINNAAKATDADFLSLGGMTWDTDVATTLKGAFLCSQAVLSDMVEQRSGVILNISSVNALAYYGNEAYSAAKAGILSLTRSLAVRYGPSGIRVNAIAPGWFPSEMTSDMFEGERQVRFMERNAPIGRPGRLEELDGVLLLLASDASSYIVGQTIVVDGGWTCI